MSHRLNPFRWWLRVAEIVVFFLCPDYRDVRLWVMDPTVDLAPRSRTGPRLAAFPTTNFFIHIFKLKTKTEI
jgi:hypothetical protein